VKVTTEGTKATVRRVLTISSDNPIVRPDGYKRSFRVVTVVIDYDWKDGRFDVGGTFSVSLSGPWVKSDGTDAKDSAGGIRPDYVGWDTREWQPQYDFLKPIINLLRPSADLSMMVLTEAEVGG
jgi:hypothetical protein